MYDYDLWYCRTRVLDLTGYTSSRRHELRCVFLSKENTRKPNLNWLVVWNISYLSTYWE